MTAQQILFWIFAATTCIGAVAVVISQNVVRMAFWLIVSLGSTAALFFLLHADFVAATQLLIYVGGTVVLLIFGVMLTSSGPYLRIKMSPAEGFLAGGVGALFLTMVMSTVAAVDWKAVDQKVADEQTPLRLAEGHNEPGFGNTARPIGLALLGARPDKDLGADKSQGISTGYLLPFEIASIHLLVVLIGAAYLARAKRQAERKPQSELSGSSEEPPVKL